ncbi:MAG: S41 family peptidase [Myxococcales bacterium]|nr:S41 family peptidase [Myxococcales bacterium]
MSNTPQYLRAALLCSVALLGCDNSTNNKVEPDDVEHLADLSGVWQQRGYARVLDVEGAELVEYHVTDVSCVRTGVVTERDVFAAHDRVRQAGESFSWYEAGGFTRYDFDQIEQLPAGCVDAGQLHDPAENFAALWELFNENYAYFAERGVDWDAVRERFSGAAAEAKSSEELFGIVSEMLGDLNDGHVYVWDGGQLGFLSGSLGDTWMQWAGQFEGEPVSNPTDPRRDFIEDMRGYVVSDVLADEGTTGFYGALQWGFASEGVGYLNVLEMAAPELQEMPLPQALDELDVVMERVLGEFSGADAVVLDVRFNQGGADSMGYGIASWFTAGDVLVSRKRAFAHDWLEPQDIVISGKGNAAFTGPVTVLTSRNTISAAETFALAMRELPNATLVGERTYGVFSDVLLRTLPNGWYVALSNEAYESPRGEIFEAQGVPPDVAAAWDETRSYYENLDATMQAALGVLR